MTDQVGVGVIGMGWMGEVHSRSYRALPDRFPNGPVPRLVVCADASGDRARAAERRFGFERSTTDWRDVVADRDVQVVNVAAPNALHRELSLAAMRDPQLQAALMRAGDTVRAFGAEMLQGLGAADAAHSIEELLAMLDGLLFTMLVRGTQDPCTLAAQLRPSVERAVEAQLSARAVARDTLEP